MHTHAINHGLPSMTTSYNNPEEPQANLDATIRQTNLDAVIPQTNLDAVILQTNLDAGRPQTNPDAVINDRLNQFQGHPNT